MTGWIKIWRSLLDWEWSDVPEMVAMWVHLLLRCNHDNQQWHGQTITRGQLVTTLDKLAAETGLTVRQLRTCLDRLKESGQIVTQTTNKNTIITICKYDSYQDKDETERQTNDKPTTNQRQTNDKPTTNQRQTNDTYTRKKEFKNSRTREYY